MDIHKTAQKFTDRNLARRIADAHMRKHEEDSCKILNVPDSTMFLYIAIFNRQGRCTGVIS